MFSVVHGQVSDDMEHICCISWYLYKWWMWNVEVIMDDVVVSVYGDDDELVLIQHLNKLVS